MPSSVTIGEQQEVTVELVPRPEPGRAAIGEFVEQGLCMTTDLYNP